MEGGKADSTLERKLMDDEEMSLAEIVRMLKEVKTNGEIQQTTLENMALIMGDLVGDIAVLKAEKEGKRFKVDFGPLDDTYSCFARCFEYLARGIGRIGRDLWAQLYRAWTDGDVLLKAIMSVCILHTLASIHSAVWHVYLGVQKGREALGVAGGMISGLIRWSKTISVKDSIEAYKQLASTTRYPGESNVEFVDKLVNKWKAMSPRLTDGRFLEILRLHLPREFLNTIYELDLDTVSAEKVLGRWNSYVRIHNLRSAGGQARTPTETAHRARPSQTTNQGERRDRGGPGRSGRCSRCNGTHEVRECSWPVDIVCNFCKKSGHIKAACRKLRGKVRAVSNPLFDQASEIFDDVSVVTDPCLNEPGISQAARQRDEGSSDGVVNSLSPAVCSAVSTNNRAFADLHVQMIGKTRCLLDTGAAVSVISSRRLSGRAKAAVDRKRKTQLRGFNMSSQDTQGVVILGVMHGKAKTRVPFHVVDEDVETILGHNALRKLKTIWDIGSDKATMGGSEVPLSAENFRSQ